MSRARSFFLVLVAISSICFGAGLMQYSIKPSPGLSFDCEEYLLKNADKSKEHTVLELYKQALTLSFDGEAGQAQMRSECAALLDHGSPKWALELNSLYQ
jgi:hypothetical protein